MQEYNTLKNMILDILSDDECHTTDQLIEECQRRGMNFEGKRTPVYNATFQLKKKGLIVKEEKGLFKQRTPKNLNDSLSEKDNGMEDAILIIEKRIDRYKKFDWIQCSDEVLMQARAEVKQLLKLAENISKNLSR